MKQSECESIIANVVARRVLNPDVIEIELDAYDGFLLPSYEAGAHIDVRIPGIGVRQYSLVRPHRAGEPYVVAVQVATDGRGGSRWIHQHLNVGATIEIGLPRNHFPLRSAERTLLIAGGIGLTPLLCMADTCEREGRAYSLVVCSRREENIVYFEELLAPRIHGQVQFVLDGGDPSRGLDVVALLRAQLVGTQIYCCGPAGLMAAVRGVGEELEGLSLHFEAFGATPLPASDASQTSFTVSCAQSGITVEIAPDDTILDSLLAEGLDVDHSCREGYCGTCLTRWLSGAPIHRDTCLGDVERSRYVAVCTARAEAGSVLVLDI
ncbi:PDR/VanB family oxidoreductase [Xanthobacter sp. KR7-65]|uniref:PDR/VanB family oxidoreductase n=1 Tax=Xanthobacter sp. KR7-65 TaxID=3156612 RepID=UPI0032B5F66C